VPATQFVTCKMRIATFFAILIANHIPIVIIGTNGTRTDEMAQISGNSLRAHRGSDSFCQDGRGWFCEMVSSNHYEGDQVRGDETPRP
jgi:hypothetical protein